MQDITLVAPWALLLKERNPDAYRQLIATISTYAHTPVADRPTYAQFCETLQKQFGVPLKREGLRSMIDRHFANAQVRQKVEEKPAPILEPEAVAVRDLEGENAQLRQANNRLYRQLQVAKEKVDDLAAAAIEGAYDAMLSMGPIGPTPEPKHKSGHNHGAEAALWCLSDWQLGKRTTSYNTEICRERVLRFCRKAEFITEIQRADHPVDDCTILFGGDMIEGVCFQFPTQPHEIDSTFFAQFVNASRLMMETVQYALGIYQRVTVVAEHGNHGRIGNRRDAVPRSDNLDRVCFELARQLMAGEPRLVWPDYPEDIQRIEIGAYKAIALHGDEIGRNGYASPMTIVQYITRQKSGAYHWQFRDAYTHHYHNHCEWALPDGDGAVFQTGSCESDNKYAGIHMAATAIPSQRLHFVSPSHGRVTAQYKIYVDKD